MVFQPNDFVPIFPFCFLNFRFTGRNTATAVSLEGVVPNSLKRNSKFALKIGTFATKWKESSSNLLIFRDKKLSESDLPSQNNLVGGFNPVEQY